jgi:hypothetical protein
MKSLYVSALAIAVAILAVSPALAQRQRGGGGFGGPGMYLNAKSVQEELKLSEDDAKKITDELGKLGRDLKPEERTEKTAKILSDNLKPDQLKRLNQIMWQRSGLSGAINNADVQTALKVDDKQKEKIKTIEEDFAKARRELFQGGGGGGGNREKMQELRKKADEDLNAVLTDDQKKTWKDLLGTEFKGEIPPPMRRPRNIQ